MGGLYLKKNIGGELPENVYIGKNYLKTNILASLCEKPVHGASLSF